MKLVYIYIEFVYLMYQYNSLPCRNPKTRAETVRFFAGNCRNRDRTDEIFYSSALPLQTIGTVHLKPELIFSVQFYRFLGSSSLQMSSKVQTRNPTKKMRESDKFWGKNVEKPILPKKTEPRSVFDINFNKFQIPNLKSWNSNQ